MSGWALPAHSLTLRPIARRRRRACDLTCQLELATLSRRSGVPATTSLEVADVEWQTSPSVEAFQNPMHGVMDRTLLFTGSKALTGHRITMGHMREPSP